MNEYKTVAEIMAARKRGELGILEAVRMADAINAHAPCGCWTGHDGPDAPTGVASRSDEGDVVTGPSITTRALADEGRD